MAGTLRAANVFRHRELPLSIERVRVDWNVAEHGHDFQEVVYVERGRSQHEVTLAAEPRPGDGRRSTPAGVPAAQRYELLPGDCFLIAPGERHSFIEPRGLVVWNLLFLPELLGDERERLRAVPGLRDFLFIEPLLRHQGRAVAKLHLGVEQRARVLACLEAMHVETREKADGWPVAARAAFLALLVHLARAWTRRASGDLGATSGRRGAIDAAIAFMEERYGDEISLQRIADEAGLSAHHFSETFKKHTGMPPWDFLARLRLDRAKELLRSTERSVTDIALSVGFGDSSYFARVFKAQVGQTPRLWRDAARAR